MILLLVRHGNTFESGETPYYVGGVTDLSLTTTGFDQARVLAQKLKEIKVCPQKLICGPLKRTGQHVGVLSETLGLPEALIDERLREMNYGLWEGKTSAEVDALYGSDGIRKAWDREGLVPEGAGFAPSPAEMSRGVSALMEELLSSYAAGDILLLCSSNGILRYFLKLVPGAWERAHQESSFKVGTGNVCALKFSRDAAAEILFWNKKPADLNASDFAV